MFSGSKVSCGTTPINCKLCGVIGNREKATIHNIVRFFFFVLLTLCGLCLICDSSNCLLLAPLPPLFAPAPLKNIKYLCWRAHKSTLKHLFCYCHHQLHYFLLLQWPISWFYCSTAKTKIRPDSKSSCGVMELQCRALHHTMNHNYYDVSIVYL